LTGTVTVFTTKCFWNSASLPATWPASRKDNTYSAWDNGEIFGDNLSPINEESQQISVFKHFLEKCVFPRMSNLLVKCIQVKIPPKETAFIFVSMSIRQLIFDRLFQNQLFAD